MTKREAKRYALVQAAECIRTACACGDEWTFGGPHRHPDDASRIVRALHEVATELTARGSR